MRHFVFSFAYGFVLTIQAPSLLGAWIRARRIGRVSRLVAIY